MTTSESIAEIADALAKAQGEMEGALKSASNPFFKSKYPDLASVREACVPYLSKYSLAVLQSPTADGAKVSVETLLMHASGQWVKDTLTVTAKDDSPQAVGSAITYLRRYALQAFAGVAPEDDDAEAAQGRSSASRTLAVPSVPAGYEAFVADLQKAVALGIEPLKEKWKLASSDYRHHLTQTDAKRWEGMKAAAQAVTDLATAKGRSAMKVSA